MAARLPASKNPPGPKSGVLRLLQTFKDPLASAISLRKEYGDIAYVRLGPKHIYIISNPEAIREVLVQHHKSFHKGQALQGARRLLGTGLLTNEGESHRRNRRILQPHFHHERIAAYARDMSTYARRTRDAWRDGQTIDMADEMMRTTLTITGKALFDVDVEADKELLAVLSTGVEDFNRVVLPAAGFIDRLPLPNSRRHMKARKELDRRIYAMIEERRADLGQRHDLLDMLLMAQDSEEGTGGLTDQQVRDEAVTLLLAGHETTANAMTWTWYLLSQNPEAEAKMHAEVDRVLGSRAATFEDVPNLKYTRMVMAEGMRMFPPAWIISRQSTAEVQVAGYTLPKGSLVIMPQYIVHRDERYFPEPDQFLPERWEPEAQAKQDRPKYSYFPFGGGPRVCVGEPFAWMEGQIILASIAQKWKLRLVPGHPVEPLPQLTLRPKYGLKMTVQARRTN